MLSCGNNNLSKKEQVTRYYNGFINSDYELIKSTLADSLTLVSGDHVATFTPNTYIKQYKWDSVFQPTYNVQKLETEDKHIVASLKLQSLKLQFLKNNPMHCGFKFYFESGKIAKIQDLECPNANWKLWRQGVDSLVNWTKEHHPELDGFINDLSLKGARNYLKAIELFENR